ncbi:hypothetical protein BTL55_18760 [Bordetella trematum]|uniref:outer membrane protein assembly factor BamE n=1 Tax=Bordetella trematum TaxID=123899 RepID=UPI000CA093B3|nr:outer membrane protein assembly factor BamE [Bordetella trematum]AUL48782.1 hypothetical protein BTL55_18760 [Bordetella trematum]
MLRKIFLILGVCMSLTACETLSGGKGDKFSTAALAQNLKVGVTTSEEVRSLYGKPESTSYGPSGPEYWRYDVDSNTNSLIDQAMNLLPVGGTSAVTEQVTSNRALHVHFEKNRVSSYSISGRNVK